MKQKQAKNAVFDTFSESVDQKIVFIVACAKFLCICIDITMYCFCIRKVQLAAN